MSTDTPAQQLAKRLREISNELQYHPSQQWGAETVGPITQAADTLAAAPQAAQEPVAWNNMDRPLEFMTQCSDGTTFLNYAKMPAHAKQWALAAPTPAAPAEPDMRHPKIQALIGSNARREIELQFVEQLLDEGPDCDVSVMRMEYWHGLYDKLRDRLSATPAVAKLVEALKLIAAQDQGCGGNVSEAEALWAAQSIARTALARYQEAKPKDG